MTETTAVAEDVTEGFVRVCSVNDLPTVGAVQAEIDGKRVAIVRDSAGDIHAIDAELSLSLGSASPGAATI